MFPAHPLSPSSRAVRERRRLRIAGLAGAALVMLVPTLPVQADEWAQPSPSAASAPTGTPASVTSEQNAATEADDPVSRFLSERGLLPPGGGMESRASGGPQPDSARTDASPSLRQRVQDAASDMVLTAMNFLGLPYRRGGQSADDGFDCSGFTRYIFERSIGLVLPRRAEEQARASELTVISRSQLRPGDLVFFNTMRRTFSHVGIYIGDHKFIHAPRTGGVIRVEDMRIGYWARRYDGARRAASMDVPEPAEAQPVAGVR